jgi:hypothetical protein
MIPWLIFAVLMALKLAIDYRTHLSGKRIDHDKEFGILTAGLIVLSLFMHPFWLSLPMLGMLAWVIVDMGMGALLTRKPFYLGTTARLDRLQRRYPAIHVLKYILAIATTTLYICLR